MKKIILLNSLLFAFHALGAIDLKAIDDLIKNSDFQAINFAQNLAISYSNVNTTPSAQNLFNQCSGDEKCIKLCEMATVQLRYQQLRREELADLVKSKKRIHKILNTPQIEIGGVLMTNIFYREEKKSSVR